MFLFICWRKASKVIERILAISKKEILQLMRDKRMLFVLFVFPVILLAIFGYAINFDVHHVKLYVFDQAKSVESRNIVRMLGSSSYFDIEGYLSKDSEIKGVLDTKKAQCVISFPVDLDKKLNSGQNATVQILIDGVDGNTASLIANYMNSATRAYNNKIIKEFFSKNGIPIYTPISLETIFWFNPELKSTLFLIPGLIAMILVITAVISISLSIVREKERGTIEQIYVSPTKSLELLLGKSIPYSVIGLLISASIIIVSHFMFGLTIKGNILLLLFTTLLFLFAASNLGIFVSSIADSQQVAFQIATLMSLLPSVILSGFIFPIESMPAFIQIITNVTPAKFYVVILRDILLKGVGLESFWPQTIYLLIFALVFLLLATIKNKKAEAQL